MNAGFQERERAYFDDLVRRTGDTWWGNSGLAGTRRLSRRAHIAAGLLPERARVLELGCGAGAFTQHLLTLRPHLDLTGCDISPVAIEAARRRCAEFAGVRFIECDVLKPPALEPFDFAVGNGILHHLPLQDALRSLAAMLTPGATILFFEPNLVNPHVALEKTVRPIGRLLGNTEDEMAFTRFKVASFLKETGFSSIDVKPIEFLYPKLPERLVRPAERLGRWLEALPGAREFAGSLLIRAVYAPLKR